MYSQSIRGAKSDAELKAWVLSEAGYARTCDDEGHTTYKVKSKQGYKTVTVEGDDGKKTKADVDVKYVAFWSGEVPEEGPQGAPGGDRQGEEAGRQPRRLHGRHALRRRQVREG